MCDKYVASAPQIRTYDRCLGSLFLGVPFFYLALHVAISGGQSCNHHVATSGGQNDIDCKIDHGNFHVHGFVHNPVLLYALSHVHSSGMTCYVLDVTRKSL